MSDTYTSSVKDLRTHLTDPLEDASFNLDYLLDPSITFDDINPLRDPGLEFPGLNSIPELPALPPVAETSKATMDIDVPEHIQTMPPPDIEDLSFPDMDTILSAGESEPLPRSMGECESEKTKYSRVILTFFPTEVHANWLNPSFYYPNGKALRLIRNWWGQFEICPTTGKLHAHVYCELRTRQSLPMIRKAWAARGVTVNVKKAHHASATQRQCAVNYVTCPRKRMTGTLCYIWPENDSSVRYSQDHAPTSTPPAKKAKTAHNRGSETEEQRSYIETKPHWMTWQQIVHESEYSKALLCTCSWGKKYHEGRVVEIPTRTITDVVLLYGAGGTGKTTICESWDKDSAPDEPDSVRYFRKNCEESKFWGGGSTAYSGQRVVHFEEFVGGEPFNRMKEVCDLGHTGPNVATKGSGVRLNHSTVLVSSNVHPAGWYRNLWEDDPKQFHPFWRRITRVLFFPSHRPDGTLNRPDENNPPSFIDQTDDWKAMGGDYEACKEHATKYWPLKLEKPMLFNEGHKPTTVNHLFQYAQTGIDPTK